MESQVTSIEQSKRLLELGVPAENASMCWSEIDGERRLIMKVPGTYVVPAFTVADLLGMLPLTVEEDGHLCEFAFKKMSHGYGVEYDCPYADFCVSFLFCNTAIDALEYAVEWFAKKLE